MQGAGTEAMAKDGEDKGLDEHTRIGVAPTPKLPGAPAAPAPPAAAPPPLDEHTQLGAKPPPAIGPKPASPAPPPASAPPSLDESTRIGVAPPPMPKAPAAPSAPPAAVAAPPSAPATTVRPAPAPPPAGGGGDLTEHTVLLADLQRDVVPAARRQRRQPPGRSDIVTLDRTHYLMGRLPSCDLRLYSQTASREHAQLTARAGRWYLTPVEGKAVLVNGTQVKEEVPLTHKMRLQLGGDELLFLDESGATAVEEAAPRSAAGLGLDRRMLALIGVLIVAALLLLWVLR
jgi:hypothetical protein